MAAATAAAPTTGTLMAEPPEVADPEGAAADDEGLAAEPDCDDEGLAADDDCWELAPPADDEGEAAEAAGELEPPAEGEAEPPPAEGEAEPPAEGEAALAPAPLVGPPEAPATAPAESVPEGEAFMQSVLEPAMTVMGDEYWMLPVPSRICSEICVLGSRLTFQVMEVDCELSASVMSGAALA